MLYQLRRAIGQLLSNVHLHHWKDKSDIPATFRRKTRSYSSAVLIPLGNLYLWLQGARVEVLSTSTWLAWEFAVATALGRSTRLAPCQNALDVCIVPGRTLGQIFQDNRSIEDKLFALKLAAAELRRLHSIPIPWNADEWKELSHGDATCHNVIVDPTYSAASWIDFDMRHLTHLTAEERHADDLRTLLFSSAVFLPISIHESSLQAVFGSYGNPRIVAQLQQRLAEQSSPTVIELAQAPLDFAAFNALKRSVLQYIFVRS